MKKLWLMICLLVMLGTAGQVYAAETTAPVYLNGEKSEIEALVVDGVSYLPLRDLAAVFALDIDWNQAEKRVDMRDVDWYYRVWVERKRFASGYAEGEGIRWRDEEALEYTPLLRDGRVWLPLRFFDDLTEAKVSWDAAKRAVSVEGVPIWLNGRWTTAAGVEAEPKLDELGNGWLVAQVREATVGYNCLWWLGADGSKRRINRGWDLWISDVFDGKCIYSVWEDYFGRTNRFYVEGAGGDSVRLGRVDMAYGLGFEAFSGLWHTRPEAEYGARFEVEQDGTVIATGVAYAAVEDFYIGDEKLARETYGLYRLTPGEHELVERLELPLQPTAAELFERGGGVSVPVEVNGEDSGISGEWLGWLGPEPFLAAREVCELLGCELIWRQESDQLEIVAEGQRLIIDGGQNLGRWGHTGSSEVLAVRISTGADGKESREEFKVLACERYFMRCLPWDFYQGLNGAKLEWDREANVIRIAK